MNIVSTKMHVTMFSAVMRIVIYEYHVCILLVRFVCSYAC